MRTKNFFRTIVAAALCAAVSISANAQVTTTGTATTGKGVITNTGFGNGANQTPDWVDIATIGSTMPYSITPDANVAALVASNPASFKASVFNWALSGGGAFSPALTPDGNADGTPTYPGFFTETNVSVAWGASTGIYTISATEQSQNTLLLPGCTGASENISVWLMNNPTVAVAEANFNQVINGVTATNFIGTPGDYVVGGCGVSDPIASTDVYFPLTLTGADQFIVKYDILYTDLTGTPSVLAGLNGTVQTTAKFDAGTNTYLNLSSNVAFTKNVNNDVNCSDNITTTGQLQLHQI